MKDPIQKILTPYEVLDLDPTIPIDKERIDSAFRDKSDKEGAKEAQAILNDPVKRALVDIFMYNDGTLSLMAPNVYSDIEHLIKNRHKIGKSWKKSQRKYFPFYPLTHLSAVFWYQWLIYEEEKLWSEQIGGSGYIIRGMSESPSVDELWKDTIYNWVTLVNCEEFWFDWVGEISIPGLTQKDSLLINELKKGVEEKIKNHISDFGERYRSRGNIVEAERFKNYIKLYSAEKRSSKIISKSGLSRFIKERKYFYTSGKMLLERLDIQDDLISLLEIEISKEPENVALKKVMSVFTSFEELDFTKEVVKDNGSLQKRLLPDDSIKPVEDAKSTKSELILKNSKQLLKEGNWEEAARIWESELKVGQLKSRHMAEMVDVVKNESYLVGKDEPDRAIGILESFTKVFPDKILFESLSSIYFARGISKMNNALKKIPRKTSQDIIEPEKAILKMAALKSEIKSETESGLNDMQKAAELNPKNENILVQIEKGFANLNDIELLDVYKAIELKDFRYKDRKLKDILKLNPDNERAKELLDVSGSDVCWFCKNKSVPNFPDPKSAAEVKMYKITSMDKSFIKWRIVDVGVPRCIECMKVHGRRTPWIGAGIVSVLGLLVSIVMSVLANNFSLLYVIMVNAIATGGGAWIYSINLEDKKGSFAHEFSHGNNFPFVRRKLEEGWAFGDKPPEITGTPHIEQVKR